MDFLFQLFNNLYHFHFIHRYFLNQAWSNIKELEVNFVIVYEAVITSFIFVNFKAFVFFLMVILRCY
jgi:hypothetical protein